MVIKKIEGFKMYLDPDDNGISFTLNRDGFRERCFMWILRHYKGLTAVDIGANIGYTTLSLCKAFKNVFAFEPDKRSRELLEKNIILNGFEQKIKIEEIGISDKTGNKTIYLNRKPNLTSFHNKSGEPSEIGVVTIDSYFGGMKAPNFFKMDVEGAEVEVLGGAMKTLERANNCKILIEVHPQFYKGDNFEKVLKKLVDIGFKFKYVVSAACRIPQLYKKNGYKPYKKLRNCNRAIYDCLSQEHAIDWSSHIHKEGNSIKIVRAILLEKNS